MAYFFAGSERRGSIKEFLVEMAPPGYKALVTAIDLLRGDDQDLSDSAFQEKCFELARQSDVIFSTPPCNTHSRAPWSNHWGPVPIRNSTYPLGFPWLSSALADKANLANVLVDFSIQCMKIVKAESQSRFCIGFVEHPEHLGIVRPGDLTSIPASIWNLPELRELGFKTLHSIRLIMVLRRSSRQGFYLISASRIWAWKDGQCLMRTIATWDRCRPHLTLLVKL